MTAPNQLRRSVKSVRDARNLADDVFQRFGGPLPVDVEEIARKIGLQVVHRPASDDQSGMLVVKSGVAMVIANELHSETRKRFTIGHELGHFLMHWKPGREAFFRDGRSSEGVHAQEIQANAFAAALLMPASVVRRLTEGKRITPLDVEEIDGLADTFGVSSQAMSIRLQDLKVLRLDTLW